MTRPQHIAQTSLTVEDVRAQEDVAGKQQAEALEYRPLPDLGSDMPAGFKVLLPALSQFPCALTIPILQCSRAGHMMAHGTACTQAAAEVLCPMPPEVNFTIFDLLA